MSPFGLRVRRFCGALSAAPRAGRSAPEPPAEAGPPPLQRGGQPPLPPAAAAPPSAKRQKITLWAGGAAVVLIVLVIIVLSYPASRQPLAYVPRGQTAVQVVDVRQFLSGPVYPLLDAAEHPALRRLHEIEKSYDVSLRRDVAVVVTTDNSVILFGRFQPERLRVRFEELIEEQEKDLNLRRQPAAQLEIQEADVKGYKYYFCDQAGVARAFTGLGSSVACFGDRWSVRGFLRARAGLRDRVLGDEGFAAAYSAPLARSAFLYRLEKPGARVLTLLKDVLGAAGEGVHAAFFAVTASEKAVRLTLRFVARDPKTAERLENQFSKASTQVALRPFLGTDAAFQVARVDRTVALESEVPVDQLDEIIDKDKEGQTTNLVLALIAS